MSISRAVHALSGSERKTALTWSLAKTYLPCLGLALVVVMCTGCPFNISLVRVTPETVTVEAGKMAILTATSASVNDLTFVWTSSDTGVATVTQSGEVEGIAPGHAIISATGSNSGVKGSAVVTVTGASTGGFKPGYVGSKRCGQCHKDEYDAFILSGHPYKLNKVVNAQPPVYPYAFFGTKTSVPNVPFPPIDWDGRAIGWDEISYVIGGYGWKARFMDLEGYILTEFDANDPQGRTRSTQWNPPTPTAQDRWVPYSHPSADQIGNARKPYNCGKCHTTAWTPATDANGDTLPFVGNEHRFQDGLPGIHGTWSEPGVHCEECHGAGKEHADSGGGVPLSIEDAIDSCGRCHTRDPNNRILASGGFIRHHEQFDEQLNGPHAAMDCAICHDPHESTRYTPERGLIRQCEDCHVETVSGFSMAHLKCEDCHMPRASKSGIKYGPLEGDVSTHIMAINTDPVTADQGMFFTDTDGSLISRGAVTLDFACQWCHNGVDASVRTLEELADVADDIH